jgi:hypothetical protein
LLINCFNSFGKKSLPLNLKGYLSIFLMKIQFYIYFCNV